MQKHHVFPISLHCVHFLPSGKVNEANLVLVSNIEHNLIHEMLNIPYGSIREFIKHQEYKHTKDKDYYNHVHRLQLMYFSRLEFLSEKLQQYHADSVKEQCVILSKEFKVSLPLHLNMEFINYVEQFKFYHSIYHSIFLARC